MKINLIFLNNFRSRRDGRNSRRCAHFHIVQRQHESWWMDFLSQINHAFNSSDFKIPYFIAQWSHKNSWNRQIPFLQWFYHFFLKLFGQFLSMKVVNQLPSNKMLINILQRRCFLFQPDSNIRSLKVLKVFGEKCSVVQSNKIKCDIFSRVSVE